MTVELDASAGKTARLLGNWLGRGVGWSLPRVVAVLFCIDVIVRFFPLDPLCFQAWECLTRYQEPGAIFQANRRFESGRIHGNLSNMGNLPELREDRPQVFTTDSHGFRNGPAAGPRTVEAVVVGDSFVAGYGVSDEDTLPVQLSRKTHSTFYNGGGPYAYLNTIRLLKRKLGLTRARAIIVWTENVPIAFLQTAERSAQQPDWKTRLWVFVFGHEGERYKNILRGWLYTSPLKIVATKAYLRLCNDQFLPNVYKKLVVSERLRDGRTMLFYPPEIDDFERHREIQEASDYLAHLSSGLRAEGLDPLVVLAPSKYSVYYPLIENRRRAAGDTVHPLARLEADLRQRGIPALDLTKTFRARARDDLSEGNYIYWLDDTHWNGRGLAVASDLIARTWFPEEATP